MIVGIHYDLEYDKFTYETQKFLDILKYNKIETRFLYAGEPNFWQNVKDCNLVIFRWGHHDYYRQIARSVLPVIESQLQIRCFPNLFSSWLYDDKIREYYCFEQLNLPMIQSWIFYDEKGAVDFLKNAKFPLVFKLRGGAGSQMVTLLKTEAQAKKLVKIIFRKGIHNYKILPGTLLKTIQNDGINHFIRKRLGKFKKKIKSGNIYFQRDWIVQRNYTLFQKFLKRNEYDTRVVVIGRNAFAFQRFNRSNDFRASGSDSFSLDPNRIDRQFIKIAFEISKRMGFDTMAYDFLYDDDNKPAIAEVSYTFGSKSGSKVDQCPGYWDEELNFHYEQPNVALFTLRHLLNEPNLSLPSR